MMRSIGPGSGSSYWSMTSWTARVSAGMFGSGMSTRRAELARRFRWFSNETGKPFHTVVASKMPSPRSAHKSNALMMGLSGSTKRTRSASGATPAPPNSVLPLPTARTIELMGTSLPRSASFDCRFIAVALLCCVSVRVRLRRPTSPLGTANLQCGNIRVMNRAASVTFGDQGEGKRL